MMIMTGGIDEARGATATIGHDTAVTKAPCRTDGATIVTGLGLTGISRFWWPSFLMALRLSTIVVALRQMLRLGSAFTFGNSPEFWMNLQSHYDLKMARSDLKPGDIKRIKAHRAA